MEFYFETTFSRFNKKKVEDKKEISKILLPVIKRIPNKIEQSHWIQKLSKDLEVKEEDISEELKKVKLEEEVLGLEPEETSNLPPKTRKELLEERLIYLIFKKPQFYQFIEDNYLSYFSPQISNIISQFKKYFKDEEKFKNFTVELRCFQKNISEEENQILNYLSLKAEIEEEEEIDFEKEIKSCLKEIQYIEIKKKLDEISQEIKIAEEEKDAEKVQSLINQFHKLSKILTNNK